MAEKENSANTVPRGIISSLAASPYILLQLVYISNAEEWEYLFCYGLIQLVMPIVLIGWVVLLVVEKKLRKAFSITRFRRPWYAIGGMMFLIIFQSIRANEWHCSFSEPFAIAFGWIWMLLIVLTFTGLAKITLPRTITKKQNQNIDPTQKTPVESGND